MKIERVATVCLVERLYQEYINEASKTFVKSLLGEIYETKIEAERRVWPSKITTYSIKFNGIHKEDL